jgi:hypothetical protein
LFMQYCNLCLHPHMAVSVSLSFVRNTSHIKLRTCLAPAGPHLN